MMAGMQYHRQSVNIVLDRDSDAFQRIEALAEKTEKPIEELVDWAIGLGMEKHLTETVRVLERIHAE